MRCRAAVLSFFLAFAGCGDDGGGSVDVRVDTFNVALAGAFIPFEEERRQPIAEALETIETDILCLQEVWTQADKELLRDAASEVLPNAVLFEDDLTTPLDDPTDQQGEIPPPPEGVPCPDTELSPDVTVADQLNAAVDCIAEFCSTIPMSDQGQTTSIECAADSCTAAVAPLLLNAPRCYACAVTQLPTTILADIRTSCTTDPNQDLAFQGQNGVMILSSYPLRDAANWVIPGTWNRRVIVNATAELPNGSELDVYCNHLTPIFDDLLFPYTGQYGDGMTGADGWEAEQFLQAQKLIARVEATSGDTPAVVLGDLNTGFAFPDQGIVAEGPDTLTLLESTFSPAYPTDYVPQCTFCDTNPIAGAERDTSVWIDHILLSNLGSDAVVSTERTFDENVIPVEVEEENGGTVTIEIPLSDHFGLRSVVRVP